jgi:HlyD family secretion protein
MKSQKSNKLLQYLLLGAGVLLAFVIIGKWAGWIGNDELIKVSTAKVERRTITQSVTANGKIQPETEVKISPDVSGEIRELYVKEGDSVVAGKLLAVIDPELYQSALDRAEAALNNSKANLATSRARLLQAEVRYNEVSAQYDRNKKMYEQKLISDAEFETAKSTYAAAKADYESGKQTVIASEFTVQSQDATLKEARKNLSRTQIYAPVSGIVSKLAVEKGERVVGTSQMAGTEMMRIANLNDMEVSVDVNENDIVKVSLGDTALIEVDAYNNRKFKGIVTEIANSASSAAQNTSDQVTNFVVKIRIIRSSYADLTQKFGSKRAVFRPGMSASVEILTQTEKDVLAVPIESVTVKSKSDLDSASRSKTRVSKTNIKENDEVEVVFVVKDGAVKPVQVKSGIQDDKYIQIESGLIDQEEVVTGPFSAISRTLKWGDKVKVVAKEELFSTKNE